MNRIPLAASLPLVLAVLLGGCAGARTTSPDAPTNAKTTPGTPGSPGAPGTPGVPTAPPAETAPTRELDRAATLMAEARWEEAAAAYEAILRAHPDSPAARAGRREALARLDRASPIQELAREIALRREAATAAVDAALTLARTRMEALELDRADAAALEAAAALDRARDLLVPSEVRPREAMIGRLREEIDSLRELVALRRAGG